jgi:hypothetical protein
MTQKVSIGRIVHYVLADGQHRPAIIVAAFHARANLTVFIDQMNDYNPGSMNMNTNLMPSGSAFLAGGTLAVGSAHQDEETKAAGTWHWPEVVARND